MKKKILAILLLVICIGLAGCGNKKMTEDEIKKNLEENSETRTFKINKVTYATDKFNLNGLELSVKEGTVNLDGYELTSEETYREIIGYYDQSADVYRIYVLTNDTVWEMEKNSADEFSNVGFVNKEIKNATDLILVDCHEETKDFGETPLKNQVYALVDGGLVLIN